MAPINDTLHHHCQNEMSPFLAMLCCQPTERPALVAVCRIDKGVNTVTYERALEAMEALWMTPSKDADESLNSDSSDDDSMYRYNPKSSNVSISLSSFSSRGSDSDDRAPRSVYPFQGSVLRDALLSSDKDEGFSLPSSVSKMGPEHAMTPEAVQWAQKILPGGETDPVEVSKQLKVLAEQVWGSEAGSGKISRLNPSQLIAIATVLLNPLALLHGPPGTGKTTTIVFLLGFLRKNFNYKGSVLVVAQSNVAVDNMLEGLARFAGKWSSPDPRFWDINAGRWGGSADLKHIYWVEGQRTH